MTRAPAVSRPGEGPQAGVRAGRTRVGTSRPGHPIFYFPFHFNMTALMISTEITHEWTSARWHQRLPPRRGEGPLPTPARKASLRRPPLPSRGWAARAAPTRGWDSALQFSLWLSARALATIIPLAESDPSHRVTALESLSYPPHAGRGPSTVRVSQSDSVTHVRYCRHGSQTPGRPQARRRPAAGCRPRATRRRRRARLRLP